MPITGISAIRRGFYVDATQAPWSTNYRMYSYVTRELPRDRAAQLPASAAASGIFGHSMGGHGALALALAQSGRRTNSVSAFAPIAAPMQCPWGKKAFGNYLGSDHADLARLRRHGAGGEAAPLPVPSSSIKVTADQFLADQQLHAAKNSRRPPPSPGKRLTLRMQPGYDHGYYFIQTFMADHLRHHAAQLIER